MPKGDSNSMAGNDFPIDFKDFSQGSDGAPERRPNRLLRPGDHQPPRMIHLGALSVAVSTVMVEYHFEDIVFFRTHLTRAIE
jgi:hypothetical protein